MGFSQEILNDTALNVAGYLIAGALLTLLYSAFTNRHRKVQSASNANANSENRQSTIESKRVEFVDLRSVSLSDSQASSANRSAAVIRDRQRNRAEVIRLAKEMLQSGTPTHSVRSLLPISDGELALLENQRA